MQKRKANSRVLAVLLAFIMVMGAFPTAVLAADNMYASPYNGYEGMAAGEADIAEDMSLSVAATTLTALTAVPAQASFLSSRVLVTRTFPANTPHQLTADEWWRMVQLATINENVPGAHFIPPTFSLSESITADNAAGSATTILGMIAMGENPRNFNGRNLVQELVTVVNTTNVISDTAPWLMPPIFYALTAANAIDDIQPHVIHTLLALQGSDGGWDTWGGGAGIEETAQFILMLEPFRHRDARIPAALSTARAFILSTQMDTGGFPAGTWDLDNLGAETTARVMEAIAALGECPLDWTVGGDAAHTPVHALIADMSPDGTFSSAFFSEQVHIGIATVGLRINPFTNLRNPVPFPDMQIQLPSGDTNGDGNGGNNGNDGGNGGGGGGTAPGSQTARITVSDPGGVGEIANETFTLTTSDTAYSLLRRTGLMVQSRNTAAGAYVYGIEGLREFEHGPMSGWVYRVNGRFPNASADHAAVNDGDHVEWLFTRNLGGDVGGDVFDDADDATSPSVMPGAPGMPDVPSVSTDIEADVNEGVAAVEIPFTLIASMIDEAREENAENIIISIVSTENATGLEVNLSIESLAAIVDNGMALTILSEMAVVTFDVNTLAGLVYGIDSDAAVSLIIGMDTTLNPRQREAVGDNHVFALFLIVDGEYHRAFDGVVTVALPYAPPADFYNHNLLTVFHVDDDGNVSEMENSMFRDGFITFTTTHFSLFFVGERERVEAADDIIDESETKVGAEDATTPIERAEPIEQTHILFTNFRKRLLEGN